MAGSGARIRVVMDRIQVEIDRIKVEIDRIQVEIDRIQVEIDRLRVEIDRIRVEIDRLRVQIDRIRLDPPSFDWIRPSIKSGSRSNLFQTKNFGIRIRNLVPAFQAKVLIVAELCQGRRPILPRIQKVRS